MFNFFSKYILIFPKNYGIVSIQGISLLLDINIAA
nr:MAG TPA: hypothetical protein [Caudoviricetes sp.]